MSLRDHTRHLALAAAPVAVLAGTAAAIAGGTSASADPADTPQKSETKVQAKANGDDVGTMDCSHDWSNKDDGWGYVDAGGDPLRYRSGPHASCAALGQAADGAKIYYHCYVINSDDNPWAHGRVAGTNYNGWFYEPYVTNTSTEKC